MNAAVIIETVRRNFTRGAFLAVAMAVAVFAVISAQFGPAGAWPTVVFLAVLVAGAEVLGPEFSSGTLQLILTKPVNRSVYVISRIVGAVATVWILIAAAFAIESIVRFVWYGGREIDAVALEAFNICLDTVRICAVLAFLGSFLRAYFNVALYFLSQLMLQGVVTVLPIIQNEKRGFLGWLGGVLTSNPVIERAVRWIQTNVFPRTPSELDPQWMLLIMSNAVVFIIAACLIYRRREVPYGAD